MKLNFRKVNKLLSKKGKDISWFFAIIILVVGVVFLYVHFICTLDDVRRVDTLKNGVAIKVVDMKAWQKIHDNLEWKAQPLADDDITRNPF